MDKEEKKYKKAIKKLLVEHLGIEIEDVTDDDSLKEDLHMNPVDLTDFNQKLITAGYDTEKVDFSEIETLNDLYEILI